MRIERSLNPEDYAGFIGEPIRNSWGVVEGYIEKFEVVVHEYYHHEEVAAFLDNGDIWFVTAHAMFDPIVNVYA